MEQNQGSIQNFGQLLANLEAGAVIRSLGQLISESVWDSSKVCDKTVVAISKLNIIGKASGVMV